MPIQIGSKFTGQPQMFIDTANGAYWEVLPKLERDAIRIQRCLLKPANQKSLRQNQRNYVKN